MFGIHGRAITEINNEIPRTGLTAINNRIKLEKQKDLKPWKSTD